MGFFRKRYREPKKFSAEELKRRAEDIPSFKSLSKRSPFEQVDDDSLLFQDAINKPIPASIEYSLEKREKKSKEKVFEAPEPAPAEEMVPEEIQVEEVISAEPQEEEEGEREQVPEEHTAEEMPDLDRMLFDQIPATEPIEEEEEPKTLEELSSQYTDEQIDDFSKASLADESEIDELEKKHMNFYSLLSRIQETHVASDFKTAYDIQDRISYLLNHKTLLYKSLVSELLIYLDTIVEKMEKYHGEISEKQQKFNRYNRKVSELKKYKFKTDESIKIMERGQEVAHRELELQKKNAEETP